MLLGNKLVDDTIYWYIFNHKLKQIHKELFEYHNALRLKKLSVQDRIQLQFNHPIRELLWAIEHEQLIDQIEL